MGIFDFIFAIEDYFRRPKEIKFSNFGVHLHPTPVTVQEWSTLRSTGPYLVMQVWKSEWDYGPKRSWMIDIMREANDRKMKLILRVEDQSVYSYFTKLSEPKTDDKWYEETYLPFLDDVVATATKRNLWGVQVYNEIYLEHNWLVGPTGGRITPEETVALLKKVREYVNVNFPGVKVLMPALADYHYERSQKFTRGMLDAGVLEHTDMFNLHFYATYPYRYECLHKELGRELRDFPVIVTEAGGENTREPRRWNSIKGVFEICRDNYDLRGFLVYCWQHIVHNNKKDWGIFGENTATKLIESNVQTTQLE